MSTFRKLYAARENERAWNQMQVGPMLERDIPPKPVDRVRRVPQGPPLIIYGPIPTPPKELGNGGPSTSFSTTRPLQLTFRGEDKEEAKSNPLYFGSFGIVVERDSRQGTKIWERSGRTSRDEVKWVDLLE